MEIIDRFTLFALSRANGHPHCNATPRLCAPKPDQIYAGIYVPQNWQTANTSSHLQRLGFAIHPLINKQKFSAADLEIPLGLEIQFAQKNKFFRLVCCALAQGTANSIDAPEKWTYHDDQFYNTYTDEIVPSNVCLVLRADTIIEAGAVK